MVGLGNEEVVVEVSGDNHGGLVLFGGKASVLSAGGEVEDVVICSWRKCWDLGCVGAYI